MAEPLDAGIPPNLDLDSGYTIQFTALDATTGAVVSTVRVSNATITVDHVAEPPPATGQSVSALLAYQPQTLNGQ